MRSTPLRSPRPTGDHGPSRYRTGVAVSPSRVVRPGALVLRNATVSDVRLRAFPTPSAFGERAADVYRDHIRAGSLSHVAPLTAVDAEALLDRLLAEVRDRGHAASVPAAALGGNHLLGMIRTALTLGVGHMAPHEVADLCGLTSFVLSSLGATSMLSTEERDDWRFLGSALSVALVRASTPVFVLDA